MVRVNVYHAAEPRRRHCNIGAGTWSSSGSAVVNAAPKSASCAGRDTSTRSMKIYHSCILVTTAVYKAVGRPQLVVNAPNIHGSPCRVILRPLHRSKHQLASLQLSLTMGHLQLFFEEGVVFQNVLDRTHDLSCVGLCSFGGCELLCRFLLDLDDAMVEQWGGGGSCSAHTIVAGVLVVDL